MIRTLILALALAGCASITPLPSPEAQIKAGADTVTAVATTATVALQRHAISVGTAEGYRDMLQAAGKALHAADAELVKCRADTGSTPATKPDPCWPKVQDLVLVALRSIADVKKVLQSK